MAKLNKINSFPQIHGNRLVILAIIFYIALFGFISLWKYYNFEYNALDLAIINQVFYNSSQGDFFASTIHPPTYLGDHFPPILFLLLPFYFLFRQPQTLLILQTIILALCAWPIYLIAKKVLAKNWALLLPLAWLINPYVQNINLFEFHFLPLAVFFIFWAFYFYQNEKFSPFIIFCLLALLVREDVALVIFMFGIVAMMEKRKIKWWLPPLILSILYFLSAMGITKLFAPASQYKFFIYYSWLGNTPLELIKNLFLKPWLIIAQLGQFGNLEFVIGLLLPLTFIPLISPLYLLLGLGIFTQLILGASGGSGTLLELHYSSLLLPAIFIATVYSIKKIISHEDSGKKIILLIRKYQDLALIIFIVGLAYSSLALGPAIGSLNKIAQAGFLNKESRIKKELLAEIPANAPLAATYEFLAPLSSRENIYSFNYAFLGKQQFLAEDYNLPAKTEYILIDFQDLIAYQLQYGQNPFYQKQYEKAVKSWKKNLAGFGLIDINGSVGLYKAGAKDKYNLVEISDDYEEELTEGIKYIKHEKTDDHYEIFWAVNFPLKKDYAIKIDGIIYPFGYGLLNNIKEGEKKIIQTNYWLENIDEIELIEIISGGIEINAVRGTESVIDKTTKIGEIIFIDHPPSSL